MNTPIHDFLKNFCDKKTSRFFMPGHKGTLSPHDITEIEGADALFLSDCIIADSEQNATELFGSKSTIYGAGGSTSCIGTMLLLTTQPNDTIIASRNAHVSFYNFSCLLNLNIHWVFPDYNDNLGISGQPTAEQIEKALLKAPKAKAVYITSPDYMGIPADMEKIALLCNQHNVPLLVDNAHGAHLKFLSPDRHPISLGATLACDSAHKTLPALTGAAYLHSTRFSKVEMKQKMSMISSTSPSYLILESLDLLNVYLSNNACSDFSVLTEKRHKVIVAIEKAGFTVLNSDISKITIDTRTVKEDVAALMRKSNIEPEYTGTWHIVLLLSPFNTDQDFLRLISFFENTKFEKVTIGTEKITIPKPQTKMSMHDAFFANSEIIKIDKAIGRISAETISTCPPGVPIVVCGEEILEFSQKYLKITGKTSVKVVK